MKIINTSYHKQPCETWHLETHNSEQLISQCQNKGYKVFNIERDNKPNLLFVWDKSGNCFEIKDEKPNN